MTEQDDKDEVEERRAGADTKDMDNMYGDEGIDSNNSNNLSSAMDSVLASRSTNGAGDKEEEKVLDKASVDLIVRRRLI
jgi:hypothetical protein